MHATSSRRCVDEINIVGALRLALTFRARHRRISIRGTSSGRKVLLGCRPRTTD
jgi:hypothetical protein